MYFKSIRGIRRPSGSIWFPEAVPQIIIAQVYTILRELFGRSEKRCNFAIALRKKNKGIMAKLTMLRRAGGYKIIMKDQFVFIIHRSFLE